MVGVFTRSMVKAPLFNFHRFKVQRCSRSSYSQNRGIKVLVLWFRMKPEESLVISRILDMPTLLSLLQALGGGDRFRMAWLM